jgi:hypothetical protein
MQVLSLTSEARKQESTRSVARLEDTYRHMYITFFFKIKNVFIAQVLSSEAYDKNPVVESHDFFDWHGDLATVLEHVLPSMQVGPKAPDL